MTTPIKISKCKRCRRAGEKLFLKGERCDSPKCALVKRNFAPGTGGDARPAKLTNYGIQLKEKQKAKRIYGLRERQFRNYFDEAFRRIGKTGEVLFMILESRLDNTIYRLGFAGTRSHARQLVNHGHFLVNDKPVNIPSYRMKIGDIISVKEVSLKKSAFQELEQRLTNKMEDLAPWVVIDTKAKSGKVTSMPKLGDVEMNIDWQMIVEFYSK